MALPETAPPAKASLRWVVVAVAVLLGGPAQAAPPPGPPTRGSVTSDTGDRRAVMVETAAFGGGSQLALEPSVLEVQQAVRAREGDAIVDTDLIRNRWAFVLPHRVRVEVLRDNDADWSGSLTDESAWRQNRGGTARTRWRIDMEWNLSRLVSNPDRVALVRLKRQQRRDADSRVELATRLYFDRRALQLAWLQAPTRPDDTAAWARLGELTARLDAMTGGLLRRRAIDWWLPRREIAPSSGGP